MGRGNRKPYKRRWAVAKTNKAKSNVVIQKQKKKKL